ncbi:MAG: anti-sigma factor [Steroidobacteraceae bacterium]
MSALPNHERLLDLLAQQATEGLNTVESAELDALLAAHPDCSNEVFDNSVAAILLAGSNKSEALPAHLAAKILADVPTRNVTNVVAMPQRKSLWQSAAAGWWSAAACLLVAIVGWWPRITGEGAAPIATTVALTPEQQRAALVGSGRAIQAAWSPGNDAAGNALVGDVVFDPVTQQGYLRFRGIPANDPRLEQYQLWIADASRTPPEPVDGGVFDTPQTTAIGDVIIPFTAKLPVGKPAAFVVTVEQPGGVVVSKQERVLALAKVAT